MPIKTYLELFGSKIVPTNKYLPPVYSTSEEGWISMIKDVFEDHEPAYQVLSILSEQEFQRRFGKLRLPFDFKNVVSHFWDYGYPSIEDAKVFMDTEIAYYVDHRLPEWEKMYQALLTEYNPLENYDRIEDTTETLTKEGEENTEYSGSESDEKQGTESLEKQGSEVYTPTGTEKVETKNNYNGFNSSTSVPVSDGSSETSFDQRADTTSFNQRKDVTSFNQRKDVHSFTDRKDTLSFDDRTDTRVIDGHIHGNIGVTTSQQMLESELQLRLYDLANVIYKDIARTFLLSIY